MPNDTYKVKKVKGGFVVVGVRSGKKHSKKPMTKGMAIKQQRAIYRSENMKGKK
jgi:hypothetical protein